MNTKLQQALMKTNDAIQQALMDENGEVNKWEFALNEKIQEAQAQNDPVNHPSHYTQGKIECIDFIQDKKLNFCRGNAVKYIVRAGLKDPDKEIEDLEKAIFYLNAEIKDIKKRAEDG